MRAPVTASSWPTVVAPPAWRSIDFISDLHLHPDEPKTFLAWRHYLAHTPAQAVFILGDLFEVWVGDDAASADGKSFEARCAKTLARASAQRTVYFMCGNRDFLLGATFAAACGMHLLADPCVLEFAGQRWLLSHGDALCLADTEYLQFRAQVRSPAWQQAFLAEPLAQRRVHARELRTRSEARKQIQQSLFDADADEARAWLRAADANCLIHGHTHRPADHVLDDHLKRIVLSDWDLHATPARAEVLRIDAGGQMQRLGVHRLASQAP